MSSQTKQEKKVMDEKIAKVREVVRNVSTNDIVLALHNFELDVERTIHAFCEGGSEGALGSWESGTAKKNKQKGKPKSAATVAAVPPAPASTGSSSSSRRATGNGSVNSRAAAPTEATSQPNGYSNGYINKDNNNIAHAHPQQQHQPANNNNYNNSGGPTAHSNASNNTSSNINNNNKSSSSSSFATSSLKGNAGQQHQVETSNRQQQKHQVSSQPAPGFEHMERSGKGNGEMGSSSSQAEADLFKCFQEIRQTLAKRESQLIAQLGQQQQDGGAVRFAYDNSKLVDLVAHLGQVVPMRNEGTPLPAIPLSMIHSSNGGANQSGVNHSTSHSSLVSSVGEDSGLGQTSPVLPEKSAVTAQVDNGGIVMQSDALSADQLADLQRRIEETLRAQGIDPSVLSEFTGSNSVAPRKRPPKPAGGNRDHKGSVSSSGNNNNSARNGGGAKGGPKHGKQTQNQVKLSILQ